MSPLLRRLFSLNLALFLAASLALPALATAEAPAQYTQLSGQSNTTAPQAASTAYRIQVGNEHFPPTHQNQEPAGPTVPIPAR